MAASEAATSATTIMTEDELVTISKRLLLAIRKSDGIQSPAAAAAALSASSSNADETAIWKDIREQQTKLQEQVTLKALTLNLSENGKKAFWINIYNSFLQLSLRRHHQKQRENGSGDDIMSPSATPSSLYTTRDIPIAGRLFSLDDVEHGLLRKCRWKHLYGYLPNAPMQLCSPIAKLAVQKLDCRIHFALNCGAKSCPPIAYYSTEKIDAQLDQATRAFLRQETDVNRTNREIRISKIFYWYTGDFGGKKGIHKLLKKYCRNEDNDDVSKQESSSAAREDTSDYRLVYKGFSWEQSLDNYAFDADETSSSATSQR